MMINDIMCTSKILTDLCFIKQKTRTKSDAELFIMF